MPRSSGQRETEQREPGSAISSSTEDLKRNLVSMLSGYGRCLVAFSAGVDSTVVAKAARLALNDGAVAVTGSSASMATGELDEAIRMADLIGIRHQIIDTQEFASADYTRNAPDRCYHCKTELYSQIARLLPQYEAAVIVNGANVDDASDYRPGMVAAGEYQVRSPLAECGIGKAAVREIAASWDLPVWDKPATPCLSSRVAYGEEVTPERLLMIDRGEQFLRQFGFREVRVRYHRGNVARIEVPLSDLGKLCQEDCRRSIVEYFRTIGFLCVTIDLEGFRSGSMNTLVPVESLQVLDRRG